MNSRPRIVFNFLAIFVLVLSSASTGWGFQGSQPERVFLSVPAGETEKLHSLGLSAYAVEDYGSFVWLELDPSAAKNVQDALPGARVERDAAKISAGSRYFDPLVEGEPEIPAAMLADKGESGLRLVQFHGPVKDEWLAALRATGADVLQYYPGFTYLIWATPQQAERAQNLAATRWTGEFHPAYKLSAALAGAEGLIENVAITFYNNGDREGTVNSLIGLGAALVQQFPAQPDGAFYTVIVRMDASRLAEAARIPSVWAIEYAAPRPGFDDEIGAQIIAGNTPGGTPVTGYYAWLASKGVNGQGITWADVDTGLNASHPDITGRAAAFVSYPGAGAANTDPDGHGSHTAGAIFGDGQGGTGLKDANGFYWGVGAAPEASLVVQNALMSSDWPPVGGWQLLSKDSVVNGAMGSSNSWYTGASGAQGYSSAARTHDIMVRDANFDTTSTAEPIVMVFSAGNAGPSPSTITEPKEAKNLIVVGASENYPRAGGSINDLPYFTSRGPALDGRLLPNVIAAGDETASFNGSGANCGSTVPGAGATYYNFCSGTSMAAPFVSGSAALIADWWAQEGRGVPSPAMTKALLINGAADMVGGSDGASGTLTNIPNNNQGWGRVNLDNVIRNGWMNLYNDQSAVLHNTGEVWTLDIGVPDPTKPLKISLVWSDAPGAVNASPALVNNLNLQVVNGGATYLGNRFNGGWSVTGGSVDALNNIENVYIQNPGGSATITISAANIAGDGVPYNGDLTDQDFALVCSNCTQISDFTLNVLPTNLSVCAPADGVFTVDVGSILGFADPVTLSAVITPTDGLSASFAVNPLTPPDSTTLTIGATGAAAVGGYAIGVTGTAPTSTHATTLGLSLFDASPGATTLVAPANSALNQAVRPTFEWTAASQGDAYTLEVATDNAFANIVLSASGLTRLVHTFDVDLNTNTQYFWRVRADNACGTGANSATYRFTTVAAPGDCSVGTLPNILFSDTFESGAAGWTHSGAGDSWALSSTRVHSGAFSYHADAPAVVSDQRLVSPQVALPSGQGPLTLKFWNQQTFEDRTGGCYDGAIVEASTDGGVLWNQLLGPAMLTDPYDGPISTGYSNPLGGKDAWCGDPQDWLNAIVNLDDYAGQNVQFRFRVGTDTSAGREGWYLDDVVVQSCAPAVYSATLTPANSSLTTPPGSVVTHTFMLDNVGLSDSYTLTLSQNGWPTTLLTPSPLAVASGTSVAVHVQVDVPTLALEVTYDLDDFLLTVESLNEPGLVLTATGSTESAILPGLLLTPVNLARSGSPGEVVTHTFTLVNSGNFTDTYALAVTPSPWLTTVPATSGPVAAGGTKDVIVQVQIPNQPVGEAVIASEAYTLTATSGIDPLVEEQAFGVTNANVNPGVALTPAVLNGAGKPGDTISYTLYITNTGDYTDTFNLIYSGNAWPLNAPAHSNSLPPGASHTFEVGVRIPATPAIESQIAADSLMVRAESKWDSLVYAQSQASTLANAVLGVEIYPAAQSKAGLPGEVIAYTFHITNTGEYTDTYALAVSGNAWTTAAAPFSDDLPPGASDEVVVSVTIPVGPERASIAIQDAFTLTVTSHWDALVSAQAGGVTTGNITPGVGWSAAQIGSGLAGTEVVYTLTVINQGNYADRFDLSASGVWTSTLNAATTPLLLPGEGFEVRLMVAIPQGAADMSEEATTLLAVSQLDDQVSAQVMVATRALWQRLFLPLIER